MPDNSLEDKFVNLKASIKKHDKAAVAFSGGVDSTFLLAVCAEILGTDNVAAITAHSEVHTEFELSEAKKLAAMMGLRHIIVRTGELNDPVFLANPKERCFFCKKHFYSEVAVVSKEMNIDVIFDGTNADDVADYRPGQAAAREFGIKSPLMENGLTKNDIRLLSKKMNLPTWNYASNSCLASRIPYGNPVTKEKLVTIAKAEEYIRTMGFAVVRVRHHDTVARIEIPVDEMPHFIQEENRMKVNQYLKSLGFVWIALDFEGYRTGSMNSAIEEK